MIAHLWFSLKACSVTIACLLLLACVEMPAVAETGSGAAQAPDRNDAQAASEIFFKRHDRDRDGSLSKMEFPPHLRKLHERADTDADGQLSPKEDIAFRERMRDGAGTRSSGAGTGSRGQAIGSTPSVQPSAGRPAPSASRRVRAVPAARA